MATELECMRSLLLTTMDVGLAVAFTDVVVVLEDVGVAMPWGLNSDPKTSADCPMIVMV